MSSDAPSALSLSSFKHPGKNELKALFISDLHLRHSLPKTTQAFFDFLEQHAVHAKQLYFLGDIFEFWAGDDTIHHEYIQSIVHAIRRASDAGTQLFWISGNRDFLVGKQFAEATGITLLPEIFVTNMGGQKIILTHGDAQCTDDYAYMEFRAKVRSPELQKQFLAMSLAERMKALSDYRKSSQDENKAKNDAIMDVNESAIVQLFEQTGASILIHGHTHRPGKHVDSQTNRIRYVLPDWDMDAEPEKGGWIELTKNGEIRLHLLS